MFNLCLWRAKKDTTENAYVMEMFVTNATVFPADVPIAERWDNFHAFCFNTQSTSRHFTSCCHGKLILFLCLIKHHSKNAYTYVGEEVQLHIFLTSALDRSVFSFMLGIIYSRGRVMEREAVRETEPSGNLECRKVFCFDRKSNTIFVSHYSYPGNCIDWAIWTLSYGYSRLIC